MPRLENEMICPWCGKVSDGASSTVQTDDVPVDGDFNVCVRCGGPSIYTDAGQAVRAMSLDELDHLPQTALDDIRQEQKRIRGFNNWRREVR